MNKARVGDDGEMQPAIGATQQQIARRIARAGRQPGKHRVFQSRRAGSQRIAGRHLPSVAAGPQRPARHADAIQPQRRIAPVRPEPRADRRSRRRDDAVRARHPPG
ncbi:hypothetical protein ACM61V_01335 [Sphingomonas sp. TX0543]|uniref:hypothetical protein n=1 Tax=unclassified Sphingomonas TaxID=196159 RepID=UPI001484FCF3